MELATEIVVAYLAKRAVEPEHLPALVQAVMNALVDGGRAGGNFDVAARVLDGAVAQPQHPDGARSGERSGNAMTPAVAIEKSITPDYLLSLEDGRPYRTLKRHLMARYGMTPDDYRQKWNLAPDYPMAAPNYSAERSKVAKRIGLGGAQPSTRKAQERQDFKPSKRANT